MSNRDKFKEWISGNYNIRHPFNDLLDLLILSDEMPSPYDLEDHTHTISDIVSLQIALDGKSDIDHTHNYDDLEDKPSLFDGTWSNLTGKPTTFSPSAHTHEISDIDDLQDALDGKSDIGHSHDWGDITGKPSTFPASTHSHDISDITNLQLALDGKAPTSHTHTISQVTNLQTELDGKIPKSPKAAARTNVATGTSGLAVTVLGLSVISAAALTRLDEYGAAINDILSRLRSREIIAT